MTIPSFDWCNDRAITKPRILVLEVRDRNKPDGDPIAWLIVEREETYCKDDSGHVWEASMCLSYEAIEPKHPRCWRKGFFSGKYFGYSEGTASVSLTGGAVFLDPPELQGHRIGTYLMNEIVTWAKQWPDAIVQPVTLVERQAQADNKDRRNRFYERFGLVFDYADPEHRKGQSRPMPVSSLKNVETWKENIRELDIREYIAGILHDNERMELDLSTKQLAIQCLLDESRRAADQPFRWALRQTWWRISPLLLPGGILLAFVVVLIVRIKQWSP